MKSRIGVGIVGFGTVGTGVAKVLLGNAPLISRRIGVPIELLRIADVDVTKDRGVALAPGVLTTEVNRVLTDPNIDIVV
ncbi:MAG TPA: homoserine dehydrogenase, partial [Nitrospira sp.]|nr:homoserine dehydrogenase [Nitrospira sp.]